MNITYNELGGGFVQFYGSYKGMAVKGSVSFRKNDEGLDRIDIS